VKRNSSIPFVVRTAGLETKVLGTEFNINAYPKNEFVAVTLESGSVSVTGSLKENLLLNPGEQAKFSLETRELTKSAVDISQVISWREKRLIFDDTPIDEAFNTLERWYGVEFIFNNDPQLNCYVNGVFEKAPLAAVLENLSFVKDFEFELIESNQVIIKGQICK
ncbi:MAG: FecR domain-containing protein, partial [Bacteroidota bacterium]